MEVSDLQTHNWYYPLNENAVSLVTILFSGKNFSLPVLASFYVSSSFFLAAPSLPIVTHYSCNPDLTPWAPPQVSCILLLVDVGATFWYLADPAHSTRPQSFTPPSLPSDEVVSTFFCSPL